jgi:hypothetical protein
LLTGLRIESLFNCNLSLKKTQSLSSEEKLMLSQP